ncbi:MAG: SIMPL domain-containing protein [Chloroflexi bacterium]|nr:SIMPL domain-containing protein [Chloroflexota bacterium]
MSVGVWRRSVNDPVRGTLRARYRETEGIAARDISTRQVSLSQVIGYSGDTSRPAGYQATQSLGVRVRDLAMADGRRTAEALAQAGGVRLGLPISIREGGRDTSPPQPMFRAKAEMAMSADTPIAAGETDIEVSVEVTWGILG